MDIISLFVSFKYYFLHLTLSVILSDPSLFQVWLFLISTYISLSWLPEFFSSLISILSSLSLILFSFDRKCIDIISKRHISFSTTHSVRILNLSISPLRPVLMLSEKEVIKGQNDVSVQTIIKIGSTLCFKYL